ncbi:MAG: histidine phosphatase family protein [Bacillota bacterium]
MSLLYIVRHSIPATDPSVAAERWPLSDAGIRAAQQLGELSCWQDVEIIYSSPEPKALQTAEEIARQWGTRVIIEGGLRELQMKPVWLESADFIKKVGDYLEGADDPDFEPYDQAQRRIVDCVQRLTQSHPDRSIAVVSHARILVAFLSHLFGRRLGRQEWRSIKMPDLAVVDLAGSCVVSGFPKQD